MAVHYKLRSEKNYYTLPIDGPAISVIDLKIKIVTSEHFGKGNDYDLILMNALTNQEYTESTALVQRNTYILIRRVPGPPRKPIVVGGPEVEEKNEAAALVSNSSTEELVKPQNVQPDEPHSNLGDKVCFVDKEDLDQPTSHVLSRMEEDRRIQALVNTPALDWSQTKKKNVYYLGGFTARASSHNKTDCSSDYGLVGFWQPPLSYVCHRCNQPGHYIQHCPTNGDPRYDVKKLKKATGIPKSMLLISSEGSYSLPNGAIAVLQPNEAAFENAMEGIPSSFDTSLTIDIPPEFKCPLCAQVMKDAVLSSKCCCDSYCDKCIRDHIITKKMCKCGSRNVLADDLLPNRTVRDLIDRILTSKPTSWSKKTETSSTVTDAQSENYVESRPKHAYDVNTKAHVPVAQGIKRKMTSEEKGKKKKKTQSTASTCESSISQSSSNAENFGNMAFSDISASYYGGMPWSFDGYTAY